MLISSMLLKTSSKNIRKNWNGLIKPWRRVIKDIISLTIKACFFKDLNNLLSICFEVDFLYYPFDQQAIVLDYVIENIRSNVLHIVMNWRKYDFRSFYFAALFNCRHLSYPNLFHSSRSTESNYFSWAVILLIIFASLPTSFGLFSGNLLSQLCYLWNTARRRLYFYPSFFFY